MAKISRNRRRAALTKARKTRSSTIWYVVSAFIIVVGVGLIAMNREDTADASPQANLDHWHAALGVNVCGEWLANAPEFEQDAAHPSVQAGIHSHGDGLMHIHPFVAAEAGKKATVGKFMEYGGWSTSGDSFKVWDDTEHKSGGKCGDKEAEVRWSVNGEEKSGNISSYHPQDGDVIALAFLPADEEIGEPPAASALQAPADVAPGPTAPSNTLVVPGETDTSVPDPSATTPETAATSDTAPPASDAP